MTWLSIGLWQPSNMRILLVTCLRRLIVDSWYNLELSSYLRLYREKLNSLSDQVTGEVTTAIGSVPGNGERKDWSGNRKREAKKSSDKRPELVWHGTAQALD
jgi:hypothetical protein